MTNLVVLEHKACFYLWAELYFVIIFKTGQGSSLMPVNSLNMPPHQCLKDVFGAKIADPHVNDHHTVGAKSHEFHNPIVVY
jgi:hypothetical protein